MNICFVFLPFAYNGPCVTESGPKVIHHGIKRYISSFVKKDHTIDFFTILQDLTTSPAEYLENVYIKILELCVSYDKIIVLGGNHLSCLPIYKVANTIVNTIITLDRALISLFSKYFKTAKKTDPLDPPAKIECFCNSS